MPELRRSSDRSGSSPADDLEPAAEPEPEPDAEPIIEMWSGRPLTAAQADAVTRQRRARVVLVAGMAESGKTTLMASLFDRFQRGPFAGYRFGGSRTLMAFEERCFDSRLASGRSEFVTPRTRIGGPGAELLHLNLEHVESREYETLLLPDLPAERFEAATNEVATWHSLPIADRIDRLTILVDGESLLRDDERWTSTAKSETLLRGALEAAVVVPEAIDLIVTKWDKVVAAHAEAVAEEAEAMLMRTGARVAGTALHPAVHCAARSTNPDIEPGFGLAELLHRWLAPLPQAAADRPVVDRGARVFCRFDEAHVTR